MRADKLRQIIEEIYIEMYKQAEPPADFRELKKLKYDFYKKHYLDDKSQEVIIDKILSKYNPTKYEKNIIKNTIYLGVSPITKK